MKSARWLIIFMNISPGRRIVDRQASREKDAWLSRQEDQNLNR